MVDLKKFRRIAAGDRLRGQYQGLSQDPNSLANLDQDLPNNMIHQVAIKSLPQEWLYCETWCSEAEKAKAKTIDLVSVVDCEGGGGELMVKASVLIIMEISKVPISLHLKALNNANIKDCRRHVMYIETVTAVVFCWSFASVLSSSWSVNDFRNLCLLLVVFDHCPRSAWKSKLTFPVSAEGLGACSAWGVSTGQ